MSEKLWVHKDQLDRLRDDLTKAIIERSRVGLTPDQYATLKHELTVAIFERMDTVAEEEKGIHDDISAISGNVAVLTDHFGEFVRQVGRIADALEDC